MKRRIRSAALVAALIVTHATTLAATAADTPAMLDRSMEQDANVAAKPPLVESSKATKPVTKLTPAGRAALRVSRKAQTLPGPALEKVGGPLAQAEEAYANRAYPAGSIPFALTLDAQKANAKVKIKGGPKFDPKKWELIGPSEANFPGILAFSGADYTTSGRVTAMAIAPGCSDQKEKGKGKDKLGKCYLWVAAAGGGVWRTDNPLSKDPHWKYLTDDFATNAIGALTYDAANGVLYAGTGEPNASGDSEAGLGIYKSTDSGDHWTKLAGIGTSVSPAFTGPFADGRSISSIVIDPNNPNVMYVGTARGVRGVSSVTGGATSNPPIAAPFGLWKSTDGGATFTFAWNGNASIRGVNHVELDPSSSAIVYAAAFQQGIWRSTNGGTTFSQIKTPVAPGENTDRAEFAVTKLPSGKTRMYVGDGSTAATVATRAKFFRTDDATAAVPAFVDLTTSQNSNYCTGQCWYDNFVISPPGYPDIVYLGGSFSYDQFGAVSNGRGVLLSTDAGASFTDMTWDATAVDTPNGIHPDQHALVTHPDNPLLFFEGSDGGVMRSSGTTTNVSGECAVPRGLTGASLALCQQLLSRVPSELISMNKGLSTLQFQSVSVNPFDSKNIMGGTQDNGTFETSGDKKGMAAAHLRRRWAVGLQLRKWRAAVQYVHRPGERRELPERRSTVLGRRDGADRFESRGRTVLPASHRRSESGVRAHDFPGSQSVWRTQNWGGSQGYLEANCPEFTTSAANPACGDFVPIGPAGATDLTAAVLGTRGGGFMAALARTPADSGTLWAATQTGRLFISKNADAPASTVTFMRLDTLATNDPQRFVSGIAVDPTNPNRAYVSYSGYSFNTPTTPGHVFLVTYNPVGPTATWTDLSHDIDDLPVTGIAFDDVTGNLYASSDFTVMVLLPGTTDWLLAGDDLPNVEVAGLTIVPSKRTLYAATHGRSVWRLKLK
jgi:hypothetical protein